MAVSKRTRYEVLRRDNHTCRYCGGTAPDIALTVDHVTPVSLGGSDDPSNLVAACRDCNAGKSSSSPDAPLVAEVSESAIQWAEALRSALINKAVDLENLAAYRDNFLDAWAKHEELRGGSIPLPDSWANTLDSWAKIPVPMGIIDEGVRVAMSAKQVYRPDVFRYFCGVVWRTIDGAREAIGAPAAAAKTVEPCRHCMACQQGEECYVVEGAKYPAPDETEPKCRICGEADCLYEMGYDEGSVEGWQAGRTAGVEAERDRTSDLWGNHIAHGLVIECFIDGHVESLPERLRMVA